MVVIIWLTLCLVLKYSYLCFLFLPFWLWWNIERFSCHILFGLLNVFSVSYSIFRKFLVKIPLKKLFVLLDFKSTPSSLYFYSLLLWSFCCAIVLIFLLNISECIIIPIFSCIPEMCSYWYLWRSIKPKSFKRKHRLTKAETWD